MPGFRTRHRTTIVALAAAFVVLAVLFVLWTPVCLWTMGSASECRRMTCELIAMRRPHADHGWCEAWFERFREEPPPAQPGAPAPPVE
jgi:hypothetical protein